MVGMKIVHEVISIFYYLSHTNGWYGTTWYFQGDRGEPGTAGTDGLPGQRVCSIINMEENKKM